MFRRLQNHVRRLAVISLLVCLSSIVALAQTTFFTYQGRLTDGGSAANGNYDLRFALFDSPGAGGTQIGTTQTLSSVAVSAGIFTVQLDFGANAFPGASRWLELAARSNGTQAFTTLGPRQQITSTPYAIRSLNASSADAVTVSGIPQGSSNYIQNTDTLQAGARFNIGGNATFGGTLNIRELRGVVDNGTVVRGDTNNGDAIIGITKQGSGVHGQTTDGAGVFGISSNGPGVQGSGKFGVLARGTSFFSGDTTPLPVSFGTGTSTGVAVGSVQDAGYGYLFAYNYFENASKALVLNGPGGNVGIGTVSPQQKLHVDGTEILSTGNLAGFKFRNRGSASNTDDWVWYSQNNVARFFRQGVGDLLSVTTDGRVGIGTTSPFANTKLDIVGGLLRLDQLAGGAGETLCRNTLTHTITSCDQSSLRYKTRVQPLHLGMSLIQRLRPVTFSWKEDGKADLGLIAEEVAEAEPLLALKNDKGEIEGVRYQRLNIVLINAVKEQQQEITKQQEQLKWQQQQIEALKKLVCRSHRRAGVCK